MKVIKTFRKATVQDYARAAAMASPVISAGRDNILGDVIDLGKDVIGIFKKKPGKITQSEFYKKRDAFYKTAESLGKPVNSLPGNPFAAFSHGTIKDAPLKDYQNEWQSFESMAKIYYPELYGAIQTAVQSTTPSTNQVLAPLGNVMNKAILDSGAIPPRGNMSGTLEEFGRNVVGPATGQDLTNVGSEALGNAAIEFISTLVEKKRNGETLPPIYDKIAGSAMKVQEGVENKVQQQVQGNIGAFVTDNIMVIGLAILILIIAISKK